jgi:pilus assembly protein CpaD
MTHNIIKGLATSTLMAALAVAGLAHAGDSKYNRSVESIRQPVVSYANYIFDVGESGNGGLADSERERLEGWLQSIDIGYGDNVAISTGSASYSRAMRDGIALVVARHGLLIQTDQTATAGRAPAGSVRIIVRRATASVPGCPDWSDKSENNGTAASKNYGCAVNSNLAAMVANPADLVRGQTSDSDLRTATSNRAIATYRDKALTGAGELKNITPGGN